MNLLIVYSGFTRRPTLLEGLLAFEKYSGHNTSYLNSRLPAKVQGINKSAAYDIIIFSTLFFSRRTNSDDLLADFRAVSWLKSIPAFKVATPQDEYINSKYVNNFIDEFNVKLVFSVQPENVWEQVYPQAKLRGFEVRGILTGYIDDDLVDKFSRETKWIERQRPIDIGYRTTGVPPVWYGRHAMLKAIVAEEFLSACKDRDIALDINCSAKGTISNESWYDFLGSCKYTIGAEGGTSILDYDGSIKSSTEIYLRENPAAPFSEVERNCFPNKDGQFPGYALSPRHLEACLTCTAQILVKGDYSGVLKPWVHYIPLENDFSNIEEVIDLITNEDLRVGLINRCYADIVLSGNYKASALVRYILDSSVLLHNYNSSNYVSSFLEKKLRVIFKPGGIIFSLIDYIRLMKHSFRLL